MLTDEKISPRKALGILNIRHLLAIVLSIVLALGAVGYIGRMLYQSTQAELELRGEMDVIQSTDRFNAYLIVDKNVLIVAGNAVNQMLVSGASNQKILAYLTEQTESLMNTIAKSFTGLYGWINGEYLDGAGWTPDDDYVATERPWYQTAAAHPHEIVFVDPYVDMQTGNMMMTIAELLDDGESVIALEKPVDEKICVSAGAVFDRRGKMPSFTQLYEIADQCMYESKKIPGSHVTYREC